MDILFYCFYGFICQKQSMVRQLLVLFQPSHLYHGIDFSLTTFSPVNSPSWAIASSSLVLSWVKGSKEVISKFHLRIRKASFPGTDHLTIINQHTAIPRECISF